MHFMNQYEVEDALRRHRDHPVLVPATQTLYNLMAWTNQNSDGWAYWPKPVRAADKLMTLIEGDRMSRFDDLRPDVTVEAYKAALKPIKAFRTRQNANFEIVEA